MTNPSLVLQSLLGGVLVGLSATIMLLFKGRIMGVSGILNGFIRAQVGDMAWRGFFLGGLIVGGLYLTQFHTEIVQNTLDLPTWLVALGGFAVGYGTLLGNGCTSGHGVCGISRLSPRSIAATLTFMVCGMLTVYIVRHILVLGGAQ